MLGVAANRSDSSSGPPLIHATHSFPPGDSNTGGVPLFSRPVKWQGLENGRPVMTISPNGAQVVSEKDEGSSGSQGLGRDILRGNMTPSMRPSVGSIRSESN